MRKKLMALLLAAGLGITGIAMTTQAAEMGTNEACPHKTLDYYDEYSHAEFCNIQQHYLFYNTGYRCRECGQTFMEDSYYTYEDHDCEMTYCEDGVWRQVCVKCHDFSY